MSPSTSSNGLLLVLLAAHQTILALGVHDHAFAAFPPTHAGFATRIRSLHEIAPLRPQFQAMAPALRRVVPTASIQQSMLLPGFSSLPSMATTLTTLPVMMHKASITAVGVVVALAAANPLLCDALIAGILYVLGKVTSGAITGKKQTRASLNKWFLCGLVDGLACHAWYALVDLKLKFMTDRLQKAIVMNGLSCTLFTPMYCAGFLLLLSLLERKSFRETTRRLHRDWQSLCVHSMQFWGLLNMPLFFLVPLHLRVAVSMGMHYVYLVGLALWDAKAQAAAKASHMADKLLLPKEPDTQETAWGPGPYKEGFDGAVLQPGLNLAVAKVPDADLDMANSNGIVEPPLA